MNITNWHHWLPYEALSKVRNNNVKKQYLALVGITGLMVGALIVALALSTLARDKRVADEACWASAYRAVVARAIEARCAVSLGAAWVRVAQIGCWTRKQREFQLKVNQDYL